MRCLFLFSLLVVIPAFGLSSFETKPANEDQQIQELIQIISSQVSNRRDAHPKAHGCVSGVKFKVLKGIPKALQQGIFQPEREFKAYLRSSHGSSNPKATDQEKAVTGFALKILLDPKDQKRVADIPGEKYFTARAFYKSLDIITINAVHEFFVNTVEDYKPFFAALGSTEALKKKAVAEGKSPAEIAKLAQENMNKMYFHLGKAFETLRVPELDKRPRPLEAKLLATMNQAHVDDVFETSYQSFVPSLFGDKAVKYQFRPAACDGGKPQPPRVTAKNLGVEGDPNFLREVLKARLADAETCFLLGVQVHKPGDPSVEQAAHEWSAPTDGSERYRAIAEVRIPQKKQGDELLDDAFCEMLSFNPFHAPPEHIGIGGIQRARALIYAAIETKRNNKVLEEELGPPGPQGIHSENAF